MSEATPTVSMLMPAYDSERYIADAIASLQTQAPCDLEIVVVDDGSQDSTAQIVREVAAGDPRVHLLQGPHRGVAAARNLALGAARGRLIGFLDSDDLCPPGRIDRQLRKLADAPEVCAIVGELLLFETLKEDLSPKPGTKTEQVLGISLTTALFRREVFNRYGTFDETLAYGEDLDFYLRLIEAEERILIEREVATLYRRHATNMTHQKTDMARSFLRVMHKSISRRR